MADHCKNRVIDVLGACPQCHQAWTLKHIGVFCADDDYDVPVEEYDECAYCGYREAHYREQEGAGDG